MVANDLANGALAAGSVLLAGGGLTKMVLECGWRAPIALALIVLGIFSGAFVMTVGRP
jgi:hypothetical protein